MISPSRSLLSPGAERLLRLLTPQPVRVSLREGASSVVKELELLGLVEVRFSCDDCAISLTREGGRFSRQVN